MKKVDFKEINPRLVPLFKKKALMATLPIVIPFAILMLLIHDLSVTLIFGFFFSFFWYSAYCDAKYNLLTKKYPDRFPPLMPNNDHNDVETLQKMTLDILTNPLYKHIGGNVHHHRH